MKYHNITLISTNLITCFTQTIDRVMKTEKDFFLPYISGNLGNSMEKARELQAKMDDFIPLAKVFIHSKHLTVWAQCVNALTSRKHLDTQVALLWSFVDLKKKPQ